MIPDTYLQCCDCFAVQESMESVDNPLHEAAKRGNTPFLNECILNRVSWVYHSHKGL